MYSPPCMSQPISHLPFDFTVDTSLKTDRKCANASFLMQKMQGQEEVSKRKVLALYEDHLKEKIKEAWPSARMGNRLFQEIKAKGYLGSLTTVKRFLRRFCKENELPKETFLSHHKEYLKKRLEKAQPNCVSTKKLFNEITAKGYRGSYSAVEKFLWVTRKKTKESKEAFISFHKEYLIKRIKDALPDFVSGKELFEEIRAKGYRGSVNNLRTFLSVLRKTEKRPSEVSLDFHKGYLIKRIKDAPLGFVSGRQLFKEIRAKGYRGSLSTLYRFLSMLHKHNKKPGEDLSSASVDFHKDYLTKRLKETYPKYASGKELFKEIRAKGYRGSLSTVQVFLSTLRKQEKKPSEACVEFHKEYLSKRLKETHPKYVSGTQLFKEIRAKGYRGSLSTVQVFLSTLRKQEKKPSEACVEFHKEYLSKRLKETHPKYVSGTQLFKEIRAKGYQGSLIMLQRFLSTLRKQTERPREAFVRFHKEYLSKRIKDALPDFVPTQKLFEEITDRGYRGAFNTLQVFLSTLRKQEESLGKKPLEVHRNSSIKRLEKSHPIHNGLPKHLNSGPLAPKNALSQASLRFHKDYLIKILQETWPSRLSPEQLFEEIVSRGYRGTCKEVEVFLMMISK